MPAVIVSQAMLQVLESARRVARCDVSVLITGETGGGKEIVARAIHHHSLRCCKPWVDINCAALPEQLMESEMFGHEKGAFSGADSARAGFFELAHTGSLFLDEVAELEPRLQVKLLRVLDGAPYYRVGGTKKVVVDVRIIAATNQDLERAIAQGRFRADLYHRLKQYYVHVPPLRERVADIVPLAEYFLTNTLSQPAYQKLPRRPCVRIPGREIFGNCRTLSCTRRSRRGSTRSRLKISRRWIDPRPGAPPRLPPSAWTASNGRPSWRRWKRARGITRRRRICWGFRAGHSAAS